MASMSLTPANFTSCTSVEGIVPGPPAANSCVAPIYDDNGNSVGNTVMSSCCSQANGTNNYGSFSTLVGMSNATDPICYVYCETSSGSAADSLKACLDMNKNLASWSCQSDNAVTNATSTSTTSSSMTTPSAPGTPSSTAAPKSGAASIALSKFVGACMGIVLVGSVLGNM